MQLPYGVHGIKYMVDLVYLAPFAHHAHLLQAMGHDAVAAQLLEHGADVMASGPHLGVRHAPHMVCTGWMVLHMLTSTPCGVTGQERQRQHTAPPCGQWPTP